MLLQLEPRNAQAQSLDALIREKLQSGRDKADGKEGLLGLGLVGGLAATVGLIAWAFAKRK